jgi:hypothetical protein
MPSRARRERDRERAVEEAEFDRLLGPVVEPSKRKQNAFAACLENDPILNLKGGLIGGDEYGNVEVNTPAMRKKYSNSANNDRQDERRSRAHALKSQYRAIWGVRSAAKKIAAETGKGETTIRGYMRDFP